MPKQKDQIQASHLYELPFGWIWQKIGAIGRIQLGRQRSPKDHAGKDMRPYLRVANVFDDRIDVTDLLQMNFDDEEFDQYKLRFGDVLLNEGQSRHLVGRAAIYRNEAPGACFQNTLIRFQPHEGLTPEFSLAVFRHYMYSGRFAAISKWTTSIAHLGAGRFAQLEFPLPPLNEQRRIVAKIEDLSARSQAAKQALDAIPPLLERFRQSVLAAAFRGDLTKQRRQQNPNVEPATELLERIRQQRRHRWEQDYLAQQKAKGKTPKNDKWKEKYQEPEPVDTTGLPELPEGWCWANCDDVAEIVTGSTPPTSRSDYYSGKIPFYKPTDLNAGYNLIEAAQGLTELGAQEARVIPANSVLVTCIGATIGKTGFCRTAGATNQQINALIPAKTVIANEWLYWWFVGPKGQDCILANASATTLPIINKGRFSLLPVPVPTLDEQREIVSILEERIYSADRTHEILRTFKSRFAQLNQSILAKAFRGELVPQDPNDEPASALLERIRAQRETKSPDKNGKKRKGRGK